MSHEVTDEMIRAGARVYLHEVFYPEDIAYEEWGKASELTRKVLEAALSASPTRAQAASAGEPVAILRERVDSAYKHLCKAQGKLARDMVIAGDEPDMVLIELRAAIDGIEDSFRLAAPTDGCDSDRSAAYREVTLEDVSRFVSDNFDDGELVPNEIISENIADWLRSIHAVIRIK